MPYTVAMKKQISTGSGLSGRPKGIALQVAEEVKKARFRVGLTQVELARKTGSHQKDITRLESGRHKPKIGTLERIAQATSSILDVRLKPQKAIRSR